jgi:hypothetical protein
VVELAPAGLGPPRPRQDATSTWHWPRAAAPDGAEAARHSGFHRQVIAGVERAGDRLRARIAPWPADGGASSRSDDVDTVCMGYGFMPSNEILRALGCRHAFDPDRGHLVTERDGDGLTSVAHVYAVGDCTGLGGAPRRGGGHHRRLPRPALGLAATGQKRRSQSARDRVVTAASRRACGSCSGRRAC